MNRNALLALLFVLPFACSLSACGGNHRDQDDNATQTDDDPMGADTGSDPTDTGADPSDPIASDGDSTGSDPGGDGDSGPVTDTDPTPLPRGLAWVRSNPMFISGLTVGMGAPPKAFVDQYYDAFHANATHLWANGLPNEIQGWHDASRTDHRYVAWVQNDGTSVDGGQLMGGMSAALAGRIGYQVGDEPGISCPNDDYDCALASLDAMGAGIAALRAKDPNALLYCNFAATQYADNLLAHYNANIDGDVVSYDSYGPGRDSYASLERFRRAGLDGHKPYWRYMRAYTPDNPADAPTPADLRWDAFAGALYGYTGHTWFLYQVSPSHDLDPVFFANDGDVAAATTALFGTAAQLNLELANLGRALTKLTSTDVRYVPASSYSKPAGTRLWSSGAGANPYLSNVAVKSPMLAEASVGFFDDDFGEKYVMLQNVAHDSGDHPNDWVTSATFRLSFDFNGAPVTVNRTRLLTLDKATGQVKQLPLTTHTDPNGTLDVTLGAGDVLFFKYETGRSFVGY